MSAPDWLRPINAITGVDVDAPVGYAHADRLAQTRMPDCQEHSQAGRRRLLDEETSTRLAEAVSEATR